MTKEERAYNYASTRKTTKFQVGEIAKFYNDGYEQAEKDTIERAISVLVNLPSLVIPSNYIAYFREKMLEEE